MLICRSQRKSSPLYCPVDLTVDADPGVLVVSWIPPLVSRKSKSTTPLCCPVGLTLYISLTHYYIYMQFCITLYGYEKVQIGYTLWSVDFTVRHMNLIRSAICRFYCLMFVSIWLPQFLSFSSISSSTSFLSYLQY